MKKILIEYYAQFFHDGAIVSIKHHHNNIEISMQSAQMDLEDLKDDTKLSEHDRIKGKLHLENIKTISIDEIPFFETWQMSYDKGGIFDFIVDKQTVELQIIWKNFPPKPDVPAVDEFSTIKITAEKIWWENIPDLFHPLW
ncbi:MAG: hypothetical protein ACRCU0_05205 [Candidatus Rhabdochlamydia sp.]